MIKKQIHRSESINYEGDQRFISETSSYSVDYDKLFEWEYARGGGLFLRRYERLNGTDVRSGFYDIRSTFIENSNIMPRCISNSMFENIARIRISNSEISSDIYVSEHIFLTERALIAVMKELSSWWGKEGHWVVANIRDCIY